MLERRFNSSRLELRDSQGEEPALVGYACRWGIMSSDLGGFREMVAPGCFSRSLASGTNDVKATINHDPSLILGRQKNGTLKVAEDDAGLRFSCRLNLATSMGRDAYELVKRGDLNECSFAFQVDPGGEDWGDTDDPDTGERVALRTVRSAQLMDISAVCYPAYPRGTGVSVASVNPNADPLVFGRAAAMFPHGVPLEVRSRIGDVRANLERIQQRRRNLTNKVLSL